MLKGLTLPSSCMHKEADENTERGKIIRTVQVTPAKLPESGKVRKEN